MSGGSPYSTCTRTGYEHEEGHQHHYPDQTASTRIGTGGRTRRGARDRLGYSSQPEGPIHGGTS